MRKHSNDNETLNIQPSDALSVAYGLTGNYYLYSRRFSEVAEGCNRIKKSTNAIRYSNKYGCYVARVKGSAQKAKIKAIFEA